MIARILRGVGANVYAQAVTALVQLVSVPLLVACWGPTRFGVWAMLAAIPAVLSFADGGFVLASGTAMTMMAARGERARAAALFRRSVLRVAVTILPLGAGIIALCWFTPAWLVLRLDVNLDPELRAALGFLSGTVLLGVLGTLPGIALRAANQYALATVSAATSRAAEIGVVTGTALMGGGLVEAALTWFLVRGAMTVLAFGLAVGRCPWLRDRSAEGATLPALARPAAAALAMPIGFAVSLQGVTVAIGTCLLPASVGAFVAARTLARVLVQASSLLTHALMPEVSGSVGRSDIDTTRTLRRLNRGVALTLLVPGWLALMSVGPWLFSLWTGGLRVSDGTFRLIACAAVLHALWLSEANLLLAENRQVEYAGAFLAAAMATAIVAPACAAWAGLSGVAAASVIGEGAMALWLFRILRNDRRTTMSLQEHPCEA